MKRALVVFALLVAVTAAAADDPLARATEAYRQGDFAAAAKLFAAAARGETDAARRADIRVKLAWTYFAGLRDRAEAEKALAQALGDDPGLEIVADYYTADFVSLFRQVREHVQTAAAATAAAGRPTPTPAPPSLSALRQALALAADDTAVEAVLGQARALEAGTGREALPDLLELQADALDRLGRTEDALEQRGRAAALRVAARAVPGSSPWPLETLLEARRLMANSQPLDAAALMRGVLRELPTCVPAVEIMGEALLAAGRLDEAFNALQTALLSGDKPELLLALGEVQERRGNLASARDAFRRAAEADQGSDRAWASLGLLAARMDDRPTATEALDRAIAVNGTLFEVRVVRAQLALGQGKPAEAVQHLQRALQTRPGDPWATGWLGAADLASGDLAGAVPRLRTGASADPQAFALPLAEALRRSGNAADAVKVLDDLAAGRRDAALLRARCLVDLGRTSDAAGILHDLARQVPRDASVHYLLGYVCQLRHEWREAVDELTAASQLPDAPADTIQGLQRARAALAAQELLDGALSPPTPPSADRPR